MLEGIFSNEGGCFYIKNPISKTCVGRLYGKCLVREVNRKVAVSWRYHYQRELKRLWELDVTLQSRIKRRILSVTNVLRINR